MSYRRVTREEGCVRAAPSEQRGPSCALSPVSDGNPPAVQPGAFSPLWAASYRLNSRPRLLPHMGRAAQHCYLLRSSTHVRIHLFHLGWLLLMRFWDKKGGAAMLMPVSSPCAQPLGNSWLVTSAKYFCHQ